MSEQSNLARHNLPLQGDPQRLAEQLGSADTLGLVTPAASAQFKQISSVADLKAFLNGYRDDRMLTHELPMIVRSFQHATRGEARELIALDQALTEEVQAQGLAEASKHVGRWQLRRLRPLKDVRLVQKYLSALDEGQAYGWHTIVYGIVLAVFALPLRQGLMHYGSQTVRSFIESAAVGLRLTQSQCDDLLDETLAPLTAGMEQALAAMGSSDLRLTQ